MSISDFSRPLLNGLHPSWSQTSAQADVDQIVEDISERVLRSVVDHIDEEYGRLKKRVRKFDNQISDFTKSVDSTSIKLNNSTLYLEDAISTIQKQMVADQQAKNASLEGKLTTSNQIWIKLGLLATLTRFETSFSELNVSFGQQVADLNTLEKNFDHQKAYGLPEIERSKFLLKLQYFLLRY